MRLQRLTAVLLAVGLLFNFTGCKEEQELSPELNIEPNVVEATAQGGKLSVSYSIVNPVEGVEVNATCEENWIGDLNCSEGEITFKVAANDKEEVRSAVVTVSYAGIEPSPTFTVNQAAKDAEQKPEEPDLDYDMFEITATNITPITADINISPLDPEMRYMGFFNTSSKVDPNATDDEIFEGDMQWLESWTEVYGCTLSELLDAQCQKGDFLVPLNALSPDTEYVYWVYGLDVKNVKRISKITKCVFKSAPATESGAEIEISYEVSGNNMTATFDPGDYTGYYYTEITWTEDADKDIELQKEDLTWIYTNWMLTLKEAYNMSREEMLAELGHTGVTQATKELENNSNYLIWALAFDDEFIISSDVFLEVYSFTSPEPEPEPDEFSIDVTASDITDNSASVDFKGSNETSEYTVMLYEYEEVQNATDDEILTDMFISSNMWVHKGDFTWNLTDLKAGTKYVACAAGMDSDTFEANTGLFKTEFSTTDEEGGEGGGDASDFNVDIMVSDVTAHSASISFTGNDETTEYTLMLYRYEDIQNATEDEIIADMSIIDNLWLHTGSYTWYLDDLDPETQYAVCALGYDADIFIPCSGLFMTDFTTEADNSEALNLDITISDVTANSAKATFTPSDVNSDYTVWIYTLEDFEKLTVDEIISEMTSSYYLNTHHDTYIKTFEELNPNTSYVVCAVGFSWDTFSANSDLFSMSFITEGGGEDKPANFIEIDYGPYYDAMAVAAIEPAYSDIAAEGEVLMGFNVTGGSESEILKWYITDKASADGYLDEDIIAFLRFGGYTDTQFVKAFPYGESVCIFAVAFDKNGKPSDVFRGQEVIPSQDGVGDPAEFIANFPR